MEYWSTEEDFEKDLAILTENTFQPKRFNLKDLENPEPSKSGPSKSGPSKPGPSKPGPSKSGPSKSGPSKPGPSKPGPSKPGPLKPGTSKPGPSKPGPSTPGPLKPWTSKSGTSKPWSSKPGPSKPGPSTPGPLKPWTSKSGTSKPWSPKPGPSKPGPSKPGPSKPGPSKPGPWIPGSSKPGHSKPWPSKSGPSKSGPSKPWPSKAGPSKPSPPRSRTFPKSLYDYDSIPSDPEEQMRLVRKDMVALHGRGLVMEKYRRLHWNSDYGMPAHVLEQTTRDIRAACPGGYSNEMIVMKYGQRGDAAWKREPVDPRFRFTKKKDVPEGKAGSSSGLKQSELYKDCDEDGSKTSDKKESPDLN